MRSVYQAMVEESQQRTFPQVKIRALRSLPIPALDFSSAHDRRVHDELVALVDDRLLRDEDDPQCSNIDASIDAHVEELMGIDTATTNDESAGAEMRP
jgi:hypothetical protein